MNPNSRKGRAISFENKRQKHQTPKINEMLMGGRVKMVTKM